MTITIRRVYDASPAPEGSRYLVDRLWPRGFTKERLALTAWRKDLSPSRELCAWYGHDPVRYPEFRARYRAELKEEPGRLAQLLEEARQRPVTLLFAARDVERSNAAVLREFLEERLKRSPMGQAAIAGPSPVATRRKGRSSR